MTQEPTLPTPAARFALEDWMRLFWQATVSHCVQHVADLCRLSRRTMIEVLNAPSVRAMTHDVDLAPVRYCKMVGKEPLHREREALRRRLASFASRVVEDAVAYVRHIPVACHTADWIASMRERGIDPATRILDHFFVLLDSPRVLPKARRAAEKRAMGDATGVTTGDAIVDPTGAADQAAADGDQDGSDEGAVADKNTDETTDKKHWSPAARIDACTRLPAFLARRPGSDPNGQKRLRGLGRRRGGKRRRSGIHPPPEQRPFDPKRDDMRVLNGLCRRMIAIFLARTLFDEERLLLRIPRDLQQQSAICAALRREQQAEKLRAIDQKIEASFALMSAREAERAAEAARDRPEACENQVEERPPPPPPD